MYLSSAFGETRAGNRLTKRDSGTPTTFTYDAANQIVTERISAGRTTFTHDNAGNQVLERKPTGDRTTLTWDYENRLTLAALTAGGRNTFQYNADGLRVRKEDSTGTAKFVWDQEVVLLETDGSDATQVVYSLEPAGYGNLLSQRRAATRFYHFDGIGSTDRLTDNTAAVTDSYLHEAFGTLKASTGSTANPYRFVGQTGYQSHVDLVLLYLRDRYYHPRLIRFVSRDFLYARTGNPYLYVFNSPVIFIDPSGLEPATLAIPLVFEGPALGALLPPVAIGVGIAAGIYGGIELVKWLSTTEQTFSPAELARIDKSIEDAIAKERRRHWGDKPRAGCKPCIPPVGTYGYRLEKVPPSKPHHPFPGDHVHLFRMHQRPPKACWCFWHKIIVHAPPPLPGAVPMTVAAGGGPI